jgi:HD-GYP domain-containing protein (c-di-GMP phosphodiesterase class II)
MMTAMVSVMLAEEAKMLSPLNQDKLVTGALLHDVGLRTLPPELRRKPRHLWNAEESKHYQQHSIQGAELLRFVEGMSVEVLLIISEHHELSNGNGYPKGLRDARINPMSKIVGLADQFCDLVSNNEGKQYSAEDAIVYIEAVMGQPYNKGLFSSLKNLVNVQRLTAKIAAGGKAS